MASPSCVKCGRSVFDAPLYRATERGALPPGKWVCSACGGRPPNREVKRLVNVLAGKEPPMDDLIETMPDGSRYLHAEKCQGGCDYCCGEFLDPVPPLAAPTMEQVTTLEEEVFGPQIAELRAEVSRLTGERDGYETALRHEQDRCATLERERDEARRDFDSVVLEKQAMTDRCVALRADLARTRGALRLAGVCVQCRATPAEDGFVLCPACREKTNAKMRRHVRTTKYGLQPGEWEALFDAQGGMCAICGATSPGSEKKDWHTDHCHKHGHVRGILCIRCNTSIGKFEENPELLEAAARYLRERALPPEKRDKAA